MKTKREVLEVIAKEGHCIGINCDDCPYESRGCDRMCKIGAMAILRMFKKRKKPLLNENPCRTCEGKHFQHGCGGCKEVKNDRRGRKESV